MLPAAVPVKVKLPAAPSGLVCFSTMIVPRLVLVNVQVIVSPGCRLMAVTGLPSEHVALVRSHPVSGSSLTE